MSGAGRMLDANVPGETAGLATPGAISGETVRIYGDGACKGNPGPGGWGALLKWNGRERELYGGEPNTTNNRMELLAVIKAL